MEVLDVVNDQDDVIGQASMTDVYARQLNHRIVHVLVFNSQGEMLLQKRSEKKAFCPGHWSTSIGGHVQSGETYEAAALREAKEELGIDVALTFLRKDYYRVSDCQTKFISTFHIVHDGPFVPDPEEVAGIVFLPVPTIQAMLAQNEPFHPELAHILSKVYA